MTNLVEAPAEWIDGIYQLETNDPVMGGADGIDNLQATQLAKRTAYLKEQVEAAQDGLATALGNDADFAATLTGLLALKAPLASPALTGTPTAPTPAQFDATTKVATTGFVKGMGKNFAGVSVVTVSQALTVAHVGRLIMVGGNGQTYTLPAANAVPNGSSITLSGFSSNAANTIQRAGADSIYVSGVGGITSFPLKNGDSITLTSDGAGWYFADGNAAQGLNTSGSFGSSLVGNGYQKLPSGLIIQWGTTAVITAGSKLNVTYPLAWPVGAFMLQAFPINPGNTASHFLESNNLGNTFDLITNTGSVQAFWFAIGK